MEFIGHFRRLTPVQRNTFIACFLGWSLDAFDFFILIFCVSALATQFQAKVSVITRGNFSDAGDAADWARFCLG